MKFRQVLFFIALVTGSIVTAVELPDTRGMARAGKIQGEFYFKPGTDFQTWQQSARRALVERLGIARKLSAPRVDLNPQVLWSRQVANGSITKILLQSEDGYDFPVYLCLPDGEGPFPVWICVQGHGTGMHASISVKWQD